MRSHTVAEIDRYLQSLGRLRQAIADRDGDALRALLSVVRANKLAMQEREPERPPER